MTYLLLRPARRLRNLQVIGQQMMGCTPSNMSIGQNPDLKTHDIILKYKYYICMVYNALIDNMCNFKIRRKNGRITGPATFSQPLVVGKSPKTIEKTFWLEPRCCQALALKEMGDLEQARRGPTRDSTRGEVGGVLSGPKMMVTEPYTLDGEPKSEGENHVECKKTRTVNNGINCQPQLVSLPDFWLPSTVVGPK